MLSLLYVSRARLPAGNEEPVLRDILDVAVRRNLANGVTGALVHTGSDFAQVLEGPEEGVSGVMASILVDPRHERVSIIKRETVADRSFPNWGMALVGHIAQTQQQIDSIWKAADEESLGQAIEGLVQWMRQGASAQLGR